MEKLILIGTINSKSHYASFRVDRDCFNKIMHTELYSVRSGDMEYIQRYGIVKCVQYKSFEAMKNDMQDVYKNCTFTWDKKEYCKMIEE